MHIVRGPRFERVITTVLAFHWFADAMHAANVEGEGTSVLVDLRAVGATEFGEEELLQ